MHPSGHTQAVIELLNAVELQNHLPADVQLRHYFSHRRYIGSKDKKAIANMYYAIIRNIGLYDWLLSRFKTFENIHRARGFVLLHLLSLGSTSSSIQELFSEKQYAPTLLTNAELSFIKTDYHANLNNCPKSIRCGLRDAIYLLLTQEYGSQADALIQSLNQEASFDFRVNPLKMTRKAALTKLKEQGITAEIMPYSPFGLRMEGRVSREVLEKIGPGMIEVQDEASQLAACLSLARPGQRILDLCAGAGGKTLLMAANMRNKGQIIACDVSASRLKNASARLKRAGIFNTTTRVISNHKDRWLQRQNEAFDCVFVDAPCSGSGTWRRNPDLKWKTTLEGVQQTVSLQRSILQRAAQTVRPGGRLIYATCSLFNMENEAQVDWFLEQNKDFTLLPISKVWEDSFGESYPFENESYFKVNPHQNKMDGFFVAALQKHEK